MIRHLKIDFHGGSDYPKTLKDLIGAYMCWKLLLAKKGLDHARNIAWQAYYRNLNEISFVLLYQGYWWSHHPRVFKDLVQETTIGLKANRADVELRNRSNLRVEDVSDLEQALKKMMTKEKK